MPRGAAAPSLGLLRTKRRLMIARATQIPIPTRRAEPRMDAGSVYSARGESRHRPRLCRICRGPMGGQEDSCWRCGRPARRTYLRPGRGSNAAQRPARRPPHNDAVSCLARRRRAGRVADRERRASASAGSASAVPLRGGSTSTTAAGRRRQETGGTDPTPTRAEQHARWQHERADARKRAKQLARDLAAAIHAGDVTYRRLSRGLDDYGTSLALVRLRLCGPPATRRR